MTLLQKLGWYGLGVGTLWAVANLVLLIMRGTDNIEDTLMKALVMGLLITLLVLFGLLLLFIRYKSKRGAIVFDERDKGIMLKSFAIQLLTLLLSFAVWTIVIFQIFWYDHEILMQVAYLAYFTCIYAGIIALCASILIGYRKRRA